MEISTLYEVGQRIYSFKNGRVEYHIINDVSVELHYNKVDKEKGKTPQGNAVIHYHIVDEDKNNYWEHEIDMEGFYFASPFDMYTSFVNSMDELKTRLEELLDKEENN